DFGSRLSLAQLYSMVNRPDDALALLEDLRAHQDRYNLYSTNLNGVIAVQASTLYARKDPEKARAVMEEAISKSPEDAHLLSTVATVYTQQGDHTNALETVERLLKLNPENPAAIIGKGTIYVYMKDYDRAVRLFSEVLEQQPGNIQARLNRAIAYLLSEKL